MKGFVKLISLMLLAFTVLSLFGACGKDEDETASVASGADGVSTADINFVDANGEAVYRVIRPEDFTDGENTASLLIFKQYSELHGVKTRNQSDEQPADAAEIIVGKTNREETAKAIELLDAAAAGRDNEYIICSINDDIVIYGRSDASLNEAAKVFVNQYLVNKTVTGGINVTYQSGEGYTNVGVFGDTNLSKISIVRPIYNVSYITQLEIDSLIEEVSAKSGYTLSLVKDQVASETGDSLSGTSTLSATADNDYEIIIGNCVRDGVKTFSDKDTYEIRIEDKNIYLNGGSPKAIAMAVTEFTEMLKTKTEVTSADSVLSGDYNDVIDKYDSASYYRLTWSDDFEGNAINEDVWDIRWGERAYSAPAGEKSSYRGNKELQNNYVKDGKLYIEAVETETGRYGGLLTTQGRMEYYYGYIEISTLHPRCEGIWTALYTMSAVSPEDVNNVWASLHKDNDSRMYYNETDVEECYGEGNWVYQNTFAWPTQLAHNNGLSEAAHVNNRYDCLDDRGFYMDFHTYGFELTDNKSITYTVDGVAWYTQQLREGAEQQAYDQPVFLRLAMAPGTANHPISDNAEDWTNYNEYIVDYIHIYQHKGNVLYTKATNSSQWNSYVVE